jgi:hypothetical protein
VTLELDMINAVNTAVTEPRAGADRAEAAAAVPQPQAQHSPKTPTAPAAVVSVSAEGAQRAEQADGAADAARVASGITAASRGLSSATRFYEPADYNEDGTVTPPEQAAYDAKLAIEHANAAARDARRLEADAAVKAYHEVGQFSAAARGAAG